jgi:hypothetical protein
LEAAGREKAQAGLSSRLILFMPARHGCMADHRGGVGRLTDDGGADLNPPSSFA